MKYILKLDPSCSPDKAAQLAEVWDEVTRSIVEEMLARARPHIDELHIDLREEMALELAKLITFISEKVVADRMKGRAAKDIDLQIEREQCFDEKGKEKIATTAQNLADGVWLRRYAERWKPKTVAALKKEKKQKKAPATPQRVVDKHFIPKSFIKKYWSEGQSVYRSIKTPKGLDEKKKIPVGGWGFRQNLYSDRLEAYFGLLEGDAAVPLQMLLSVEPLNRYQREALVGFIVIQRIRNPHFMELLASSVAPVVASEVGQSKVDDAQYMRTVYETLYSQNDFYAKLARPIIYSRWVVVRAASPDFVLPDVCNIFWSHNNRQYVVMPLTPKECLFVLPIEVDEPRIVPHYIKASEAMTRDISYVLRCAAKEDFLSNSCASFDEVNEEPNKVIQRIILSIAKITADD